MKVLVTGGAGFIGSNIVNELVKDKEVSKIVVLDNLSNGNKKNIIESEKVLFIEGDICDYNLLNYICNDIDVICHQAAWGSVPKSVEYPKEYMKNNAFVLHNFNYTTKSIDIKGSHIFNVGLGKSTSVNYLFKIIKQKLNSNLNPIYMDKRKGDILNSLADISRSINFGYEPKVNLEEGLDKTIDWFLKNTK